MANGRFVVQHLEPGNDSAKPRILRLQIYDAKALKPLADAEAVARSMKDNGITVAAAHPPLLTFDVPLNLPAGKNRLDFPPSLHEFDELLLLAQSNRSPQGATLGKPTVAVFACAPKAGEVDVIPQDWYNLSDRDFGYEWIQAVVRDPTSKRILCACMRMPHCLLDETGRQIEHELT